MMSRDTLNWGEDIPEHKLERMKNGEVFTLLNKERQPHSTVLMDSYGQIREKRIEP